MKDERTLAQKIEDKGLKKVFLARLIGCSPAALTNYLKFRKGTISQYKAEALHAYVDAVNSDEKKIMQLAK